jgi:hypothetical protein
MIWSLTCLLHGCCSAAAHVLVSMSMPTRWECSTLVHCLDHAAIGGGVVDRMHAQQCLRLSWSASLLLFDVQVTSLLLAFHCCLQCNNDVVRTGWPCATDLLLPFRICMKFVRLHKALCAWSVVTNWVLEGCRSPLSALRGNSVASWVDVSSYM